MFTNSFTHIDLSIAIVLTAIGCFVFAYLIYRKFTSKLRIQTDLLMAKIEQQHFDILVKAGYIAVRAARDTFNSDGKGKEKFAVAKSHIEACARNNNISVSPQTIEYIVRAQYTNMKKELG